MVQLFLAETKQEFEDIYRLRYRAYRAIKAIDVHPLQQFYDAIDLQNNCYLFGLRKDGKVVASLRVLVSENANCARRELAAASIFGDVIPLLLPKNATLVESDRFVFDPALGKRVREGFAYQLSLFKGLCIISLLFDSDICIGVTPQRHVSFYKRVLLMPALSEERQYSVLKVSMRLLGGTFKENYVKACNKWGDKIRVTESELEYFREKIFGKERQVV